MQLLLYSLAIAVMVAMVASTDATSSSRPGHMEPLGSHRPPEPIERLVVPPSPLEFAEYVSRRQPVVIEQLLANTEVLKNWQSDNYLRWSQVCIRLPFSLSPPFHNHPLYCGHCRDKFGHINIGAENGKKENRSATGSLMNISEYLDVSLASLQQQDQASGEYNFSSPSSSSRGIRVKTSI